MQVGVASPEVALNFPGEKGAQLETIYVPVLTCSHGHLVLTNRMISWIKVSEMRFLCRVAAP